MINSQRAKGAAQQARGKVKTATGRLTGNMWLELEGHADNLAGAVRRAAATLRDRLKKR
jgi:uncharacterized protein YjbJ (UPF0337 family)